MKVTEESTDALFQQYSIKEIQDIEKKLRNDIEKKKEDLRQMVGERYQDLINAADTITEMKASTENVSKHIVAMESWCGNMYNEMGPSGILQKCTSKFQKKKESSDTVYILAAHLKIIMDAPSMLWWSLSQRLYLRASQVLVLSEHVHLSLSLDAGGQLKGLPVQKAFPIIPQQMDSISQFRTYILQKARDEMKLGTVSEEGLVDIVCSIMLLEDASLEFIFQEFLKIRLISIKEIVNAKNQSLSTKDQVCEVVKLITNTVTLVDSVFMHCHIDEDSSLLLKTFTSLISTEQPGPIQYLNKESSPAYSYLPQQIKDYHPSLRRELVTLSSELCRISTIAWMNEVKILVHNILENLLRYVTTVKGLTAVTDAVDQQMQEDADCNWSDLSQRVLQKDFPVYTELLQSVLMERIKVLCKERLGNSFSDCLRLLLNTLSSLRKTHYNQDLEKNLTKYIWVESANDVQSPHLGLGFHFPEQTFDTGPLSMKANAYTPQVQNLCSSLDKSVGCLLDDVNHFGGCSDGKDVKHVSEMVELRAFSKGVLAMEINKIMQTVKEIMDRNDELDINTCYPFLSRFGRGLIDLCPKIKSCFVETTSIKTKKTSQWEQVKSEILIICDETFRKWGLHFVKHHLKSVTLGLSDLSPTTFFRTSLEWDEIEINEETEDGKSVKSVIRVPMQPSQYLTNALFKICQEINNSIGHVLTRPTCQELRLEILQLCLSIYEGCLPSLECQVQNNPRFAQTSALQLLFDVQFLAAFFPAKEQPALLERTNRLVMSLEGLVDPFDLDVFHSPLQTNLATALQRSALMLGLVCQERSLSSQRPLTGRQQAFSLLSTTLGVGRFMTLPLASKTDELPPSIALPVDTGKSPSHKMTRGFGSSPSLQSGTSSDADNANVTKSYSFFSAMGASWFGGSST